VVLTLPLADTEPAPVGRVVEFRAVEGSAAQGHVMHRVVGVNRDGSLATAGDANAQLDSAPLERARVDGVAVMLVRWVGLPVYWARTGAFPPMALWMVATLVAVTVELLGCGALPRHREGRFRAPAAVLAALSVLFFATGPGGDASAAFTAREQSVGNRWSYPEANPATQLAFTKNPSNSTGGAAFSTQPVVTLLDAGGTATVDRERAVTLAVTGGTGTLTCSQNPVTTSHGIAGFQGCSVDKVGTYTLIATTASLPSSASVSFRVTVGPATRLAFSAAPAAGTTNTAFATQPAVRVLDAGGNLTGSTASVTLALGSTGAALTCTQNPKAAVAGVATFSGCAVDKAGTYSLVARSGSLAPATSSSFVVALPLLACTSTTWMAVYTWSPTPRVTTTYTLYVDGTKVPATGADGWNSQVQLTSKNVPVSKFPAGTASVEVRKVLDNGTEQVVGVGSVVLGPASSRTYACG
jgi:hypothetical protein